MKCKETSSLLSQYLDGAVNGTQMRAIGQHLESCGECAAVYAGLRSSQSLVASIGRRQPPPNLALQLRVALSRERSMSFGRRMQHFVIRLENAVNAFMVPATAGLMSAVLVFSLLLGLFVPAQLGATDTDVPTGFVYSPPKLLASAAYGRPHAFQSQVVVETYVDANGRVLDYRIIAGDDSEEIRAELNRSLIFTVFEPAMFFGRPAAGRVVISFSNVSVKG